MLPVNDTAWPANSSRKSRERRSGPRSSVARRMPRRSRCSGGSTAASGSGVARDSAAGGGTSGTGKQGATGARQLSTGFALTPSGRCQGTTGMRPESGDAVPVGLADGELDGLVAVRFVGDADGDVVVLELLGEALGSGTGIVVDVGAGFVVLGIASTSCRASLRVASRTTEAPGGWALISNDCSARRSSASAAAWRGSSEEPAMS